MSNVDSTCEFCIYFAVKVQLQFLSLYYFHIKSGFFFFDVTWYGISLVLGQQSENVTELMAIKQRDKFFTSHHKCNYNFI